MSLKRIPNRSKNQKIEKNMKNKIIKLLNNREAVRYLIFGALTTAVDYVSYAVFSRVINLDENISNIAAQIMAILFAYVTNKMFVFESSHLGFTRTFYEFVKFISSRLLTMGINTVMFFVLYELMNVNDIAAKIAATILVVILNFIFSKLFVFKNNIEKTEK